MSVPGNAVVIGSTGGIGGAIADALAEEDWSVRRFGRSLDGDQHLDLTDEASIAAAAAAMGSPDLVVVASGILHETGPDGIRGPEKALVDLDPAWLARQFAVNAIGPALLAKHVLPIMPRTGRTTFAMLSARVGSISDNQLGGWYGYRASKAALNQLVRTAAIEQRRHNSRSIVVALHPGTVDTALSAPFAGADRERFAPGRAAAQLLDVLDGLRPVDSGKLFAWDGAEIAP